MRIRDCWGAKIGSFAPVPGRSQLIPEFPGYSQAPDDALIQDPVMDTLSKNALNLAFNEFTDVDAVTCTQFDKDLVPVSIELRPDVLAFEGHLGGRVFAKICSELFQVLDPWRSDCAVCNFFDRRVRDPRVLGHLEPPTLAGL